MYNPTARVLAVLELLQAHGRLTGAELARRLEVDIRTARRYVATLQGLGVPVEAERGRYGAYRLRPGFKLPPLMLTEDEALAVVLGLLATRQAGLVDTAAAVESALAKIERVLPLPLQERMQAVAEALVFDIGPAEAHPANGVLATLSAGVRDRRRVWVRYRSSHTAETAREFDPYGLVYRQGHWYAVGHCHLRREQRLFRLDRIVEAAPREATFDRPADFDGRRAVVEAIAGLHGDWPVEVLLETTLEEARRWVSPAVGALLEDPCGVLFSARTSNLDWMARYLAWQGCPLTVRQPPELREALRRHAQSIVAWAERA